MSVIDYRQKLLALHNQKIQLSRKKYRQYMKLLQCNDTEQQLMALINGLQTNEGQ